MTAAAAGRKRADFAIDSPLHSPPRAILEHGVSALTFRLKNGRWQGLIPPLRVGTKPRIAGGKDPKKNACPDRRLVAAAPDRRLFERVETRRAVVS
jgi:hypothetical protein